MRKVSLRNSLLFLFVKYSAFFFVLAFIGTRFQEHVLNKAGTAGEGFTLTLGYVLFVLVNAAFLGAMLCVPFYGVFRLPNGAVFLAGLLLFWGVDYAVYTFLCAPSDYTLGRYNALVGVPLLWLFFHAAIKQKLGLSPAPN